MSCGVQVVMIGHITLDDVVLHRTGETHFASPGGAVLYSTSGASYWRNNGDVGLVTRQGIEYTDEVLLPMVRHPAVCMDGVRKAGKRGINLWILYDDDDYRHWILQSQSGSYEDLAPGPDDIPQAFLQSAKGFHICPLPMPQVPALIRRLPKNRVISIDPHYDWFFPQYKAQWEEILAQVDVVLPSEDEFTKFWGIRPKDDYASYKPYIRQLAKMGPKLVVLKMGAVGAIIYEKTEDRFYLIPPFGDEILDVTGAGDTFYGSFLSSYVEDQDPLAAAMKGMVGASITLERRGVIGNFMVDSNLAPQRLADFYERFHPQKAVF